MNWKLKLIRKLLHVPLAIENRLSLNEFKNDIPKLVERIRKKDIIRVLFVISQLPKWKTESLYLSMLSHPRFEPIIGVALGVVDYPTMEAEKLRDLLQYLEEKKYSYTELRLAADIQDRINPDIVFYQEGHSGTNSYITFTELHSMLYCYSSYFFIMGKEKYFYNSPYQNICWKWFVESPLIIECAKTIMSNHAKNLVFTGSPIADELLTNDNNCKEIWKKQPTQVKRIIWAPHHTIGMGKEVVAYGNFLSICQEMVDLSKKYKDSVQWAFKPHPALKQKLYYIWGEERTNDYWSYWANSDNCQLEEGKYSMLFKQSDAIIHDCISFIAEYLYVNKPCMYIDNGKEHSFNVFGNSCYEQYYKGRNTDEIELFVKNVIHDVDPLHEQRERFLRDFLYAPNGKTACENIIDSILG